jgi:hypothetical protein
VGCCWREHDVSSSHRAIVHSCPSRARIVKHATPTTLHLLLWRRRFPLRQINPGQRHVHLAYQHADTGASHHNELGSYLFHQFRGQSASPAAVGRTVASMWRAVRLVQISAALLMYLQAAHVADGSETTFSEVDCKIRVRLTPARAPLHDTQRRVTASDTIQYDERVHACGSIARIIARTAASLS